MNFNLHDELLHSSYKAVCEMDWYFHWIKIQPKIPLLKLWFWLKYHFVLYQSYKLYFRVCIESIHYFCCYIHFKVSLSCLIPVEMLFESLATRWRSFRWLKSKVIFCHFFNTLSQGLHVWVELYPCPLGCCLIGIKLSIRYLKT